MDPLEGGRHSRRAGGGDGAGGPTCLVRPLYFLAAALVGVGCASPLTEPATPRRCAPVEGMSSPANVEEAVALLNALPAPVDVPCFLESLDRPIELEATSSVVSAQPAAGRRSPRLFLWLGDMTVSVVPDGRGATLIEFGVFVDEARTLKAEVDLGHGRDEPIPPAEPYEHVIYNEQSLTTCAFCHGTEEPWPGIDFAEAYISDALRPDPFELVSLEDLEEEHRTCDADEEPDRCRFLDALFLHGPVVHRPFPESLPTIGG